MKRSLLFAVAFLLLATVSANAQTAKPANAINQPDLVSFGLGYYDFDKSLPGHQAADFRLEYRWGVSLLPLISPWFNSWDSAVQFHPWFGLESTTLGPLYGVGGWAMDWYVTHHVIFTWSEGIGAFYRGEAARLGGVMQFRSEAEIGWRFDNDVRITAQASHISDAKTTNLNPGAEIAGLYLHIPVSMVLGQFH